MAKLFDLRAGDIVQVTKMAEGSILNGSVVSAIGVVVDTSKDAIYASVVGVNWIATPPGRWVFREAHPAFDYSFGIPTSWGDYEFTIISRSKEAGR